MTDHTDGFKSANVHAKDVVTREVDGEDVEMLRVPISSTRTDREGDRFTKEALEGMAEQIREEQPLMFQNHGLAGSWMDAIPYDQAETIGTHMDAEVRQEDDGEHVLDSFVNPDGTHPEGERMLKQVRDEKQAVKFSVGFKILNSDPIEDDAGNEIGTEFTRTDLMEDSKVGIPANRDATVTHEVGAKDDMAELPGYQKHPLMRMLQAFGDGQPTGQVAAKDAATDGGEDLHEQLAALREENAELRQTVADLAEKVEDDDKGSCDGDGDCPDGEVCVDGECVPEDEVDDDEDEDSAETEDAELRARIEELEEALEAGTAAPESKDTTTEEPDLTDESGEPDADADAEPEETGTAHETLFE